MNRDKIYFVIDTNTYAGNFEREMCAYITGQTGDCGVGVEIAGEVDSDYSDEMADLVSQESDENGCYRPCKIYPTPNYFNNGMGFNYKEGEEDIAIEKYAESCIRYYEKASRKTKWLNAAENAANKYKHNRAFQSVAIGFYKRPDDELIQTLKNRAEEFVKGCRAGEYVFGSKYKISGFKIEGFRIITEIFTTEEELV